MTHSWLYKRLGISQLAKKALPHGDVTTMILSLPSLDHSLEMKPVQKTLKNTRFGNSLADSDSSFIWPIHEQQKNPMRKRKMLPLRHLYKIKSFWWKVWNGGETGKVLFCSLADMRVSFILLKESFSFIKSISGFAKRSPPSKSESKCSVKSPAIRLLVPSSFGDEALSTLFK